MRRALFATVSIALLSACDRGAVTGPAAGAADPAIQRIDAALPAFRKAPAKTEDRDPRLAAAEKAIAAGDYSAGRNLLQPIIADRPAANWPRFLLALTHHKEKRYAEARPLFEAVIEGGFTHPKLVQVFYFYGWCLYYLGDLAGAARGFEAASALEPNNADAHFGLGLTHYELQRFDAAEQELRTALAMFAKADFAKDASARVDLAKAHARLGDVCYALDRFDEAREHLQQCVQIHPRHYEAWFRLSRVLLRLGDKDGAEAARAKGEEWQEKLGR